MKINDKKLAKNFVETIAGQWKRLNIETAEDAMIQAEKECKKKNNSKTTKTYKKEEVILPDWFDKDIKKAETTKEEEAEIKNMLKDFM